MQRKGYEKYSTCFREFVVGVNESREYFLLPWSRSCNDSPVNTVILKLRKTKDGTVHR